MQVPVDTQIAIMIAAPLITGALIAWIIMRARMAAAERENEYKINRLTEAVDEKELSLQELKIQLSDLDRRNGEVKGACNNLETALAVAEHEKSVIPELKAALSEQRERLDQLQKELRDMSGALAREKERSAQFNTVVQELSERDQTVDKLQEDLSNKNVEIRELSTRIKEERKQAEEKLSLLNEAKTALTNQFRILAQEILDEKGRVFSEQSKTGLKNLLDPFRDQLREFKQKVNDIYIDETKERASLKSEIENLRNLNQQISQEAMNLTRALKGDKKAQGSWGELILERVLEHSGLKKGVEYDAQATFRDADGHMLRPDVIVHLPEEKDVIIDSKVSLLAYERYVNSDDEDVQAKALSEHVRAVRKHIDSLSEKDYSGLRGIRSLDFVFLFMPIESAFVSAFKEAPNLFAYAFEKRIVVVTPSTLLATMRTIENIWRYERQNRNAQAIVNRGRALYDKLRLFVESMEKLGKQIETAHATYEEAMNRLVRGKGNVISQACRFPELGVTVKKEFPRAVTDIAEIEGLRDDIPDEETF